MKRLAVIGALAAAIAAAVPAGAQDNFVLFGLGLFSPAASDQWDLPVRWEGSVVVRFESSFGDGEVVWSPGRHGQFTVAELETRNGHRMSAFLASTDDGSSSARVESASGVCTDTNSEVFDEAAVIDGTNGIRVGLAGPSPHAGGFHMTETRCGGPLLDDIGRALAMVAVPRKKLVAGNFDIDLRGSAPLAVHGMTASVHSTVVAHVGARVPDRQPVEQAEPAGRTQELTVRYALEHVTGAATATFLGGGELCSDLDSCGRAATLQLRAGSPRDGDVELTAYAKARRPLADLRAAVGLPGRRGRAAGIDWAGYGRWTSRANVLAANLSRDGQTLCSDERHVPELVLQLTPSGSRVTAELAPVVFEPRTSCPGPALSTASPRPVVASGSFPVRMLRHNRLTLHLTHGRGLETDGWMGQTRADVTIVLRRTSVTHRRFRF